YPAEMALRNYLYTKVREASESFGFQEWDGPFIETMELYAAKSGEELVKKQSFVFEDRGGEMVTLRPELTPSLARMIAARQGSLNFPLRWWSFGPFWRYEQPQKGRTREFFQWNVDILGANSPEADAELIAVAATFLKLVGLTPENAVILVNDRRLMDARFEAIGIPPEKRMDVSNLVDRRARMEANAWDENAIEIGLSAKQLADLKELLADKEAWRSEPNLVRLFDALDALGVREYVKFDPNIVRGLLYYTGTVFEAFDLSGSLKRSILGGGRYDNLLADVGGEKLPATGFAMGDVVMGIFLQEAGLLPDFSASPAPVMVTVFSPELWKVSLELSAALREAGLKVLIYPEPAKLQKQFKYADKMGIRVAITVGPDEAERDEVSIKDLKTGLQKGVARTLAVEAIREMLKQ
ncbi:MAG TPA: histidine--tRNA ligase, partial [Anaerolineales bacterium]